jgi:hypothetical protein
MKVGKGSIPAVVAEATPHPSKPLESPLAAERCWRMVAVLRAEGGEHPGVR